MTDRQSIEVVFRTYDKNHDGMIDRKEVADLFQYLDSSWCESKLEKLFKVVDADGSDSISVEEFLDWCFGGGKKEKKLKAKGKAKAKAKPKATKKANTTNLASFTSDPRPVSPPVPAKNGGESSSDSDSSSSSSDDENEKAVKPKKEKVLKKRKAKKPLYSVEQLYELLTMRDGKVTSRLSLYDLAELFLRCREQGIGPRLTQLVPQRDDRLRAELAEDVSPLEIGHLYALIEEKPDCSAQDAREQVANVKDVCRSMDTIDFKAMGLDPESTIRRPLFQRLLELISAATCVDEDQLLAQFAWVQTGRFDMTDAMAEEIMEKVFLRSDDKQSLLSQHIKSNDFMRMCHVFKLTDNDGKTGIPHAKASLFFSNTVRHLPSLMSARDEKRNKAKGRKPKPAKSRKEHKSVHGRLHMSVLFEELWKAWPDKDGTPSPLCLAEMLLERAKEGDLQS